MLAHWPLKKAPHPPWALLHSMLAIWKLCLFFNNIYQQQQKWYFPEHLSLHTITKGNDLHGLAREEGLISRTRLYTRVSSWLVGTDFYVYACMWGLQALPRMSYFIFTLGMLWVHEFTNSKEFMCRYRSSEIKQVVGTNEGGNLR